MFPSTYKQHGYALAMAALGLSSARCTTDASLWQADKTISAEPEEDGDPLASPLLDYDDFDALLAYFSLTPAWAETQVALLRRRFPATPSRDFSTHWAVANDPGLLPESFVDTLVATIQGHEGEDIEEHYSRHAPWNYHYLSEDQQTTIVALLELYAHLYTRAERGSTRLSKIEVFLRTGGAALLDSGPGLTSTDFHQDPHYRTTNRTYYRQGEPSEDIWGTEVWSPPGTPPIPEYEHLAKTYEDGVKVYATPLDRSLYFSGYSSERRCIEPAQLLTVRHGKHSHLSDTYATPHRGYPRFWAGLRLSIIGSYQSDTPKLFPQSVPTQCGFDSPGTT